MKIEVSDQVLEFIRRCPPEPRQYLREGLRKLAYERGDIKPLRDDLEGYYRLRIRDYRIIFRYQASPRGRIIFCPFVEGRNVVYEAFLGLLD
jgi:mRNA-degrading endonuclease RelE of RelBE toxin-antitoxin system